MSRVAVASCRVVPGQVVFVWYRVRSFGAGSGRLVSLFDRVGSWFSSSAVSGSSHPRLSGCCAADVWAVTAPGPRSERRGVPGLPPAQTPRAHLTHPLTPPPPRRRGRPCRSSDSACRRTRCRLTGRVSRRGSGLGGLRAGPAPGTAPARRHGGSWLDVIAFSGLLDSPDRST